MRTDRLPLLLLGAFGGSFAFGRLVLSRPAGGTSDAPATDAPAPAADPFADTSASIEFPGVVNGVYPITDQFGNPVTPPDGGGLPGGGPVTEPPPYPPPPAPPVRPPPSPVGKPPPAASPHYRATVTRATSLWNPETKKWVYNGPNQIKVGTALIVRSARYSLGGKSTYPVVSPYAGYYVPHENVRLGARA